jgi:hypothetical protein
MRGSDLKWFDHFSLDILCDSSTIAAGGGSVIVLEFAVVDILGDRFAGTKGGCFSGIGAGGADRIFRSEVEAVEVKLPEE